MVRISFKIIMGLKHWIPFLKCIKQFSKSAKTDYIIKEKKGRYIFFENDRADPEPTRYFWFGINCWLIWNSTSSSHSGCSVSGDTSSRALRQPAERKRRSHAQNTEEQLKEQNTPQKIKKHQHAAVALSPLILAQHSLDSSCQTDTLIHFRLPENFRTTLDREKKTQHVRWTGRAPSKHRGALCVYSRYDVGMRSWTSRAH